MPEAISNTSPLLYLYRIETLDWLPELFTQIWTPMAVVHELQEGRRKMTAWHDALPRPLVSWCG